MVQGSLPPIFGKDWQPKSHLKFQTLLDVNSAKAEVMRFVIQRHDGMIALAGNIWDHVIGKDVKSFDGPSWHEFSKKYVIALNKGLIASAKSVGIDENSLEEVIPRRSQIEFLERRQTYFLLDMRLCMRRIGHYMSVDLEQRIDWQRWMTRTRMLDENLKELFMNGSPTPDGGRFGGKGFRSTWQEGIVAAASAIVTNPDAKLGSTPGNGYDGDLVAPMIRDVGLGLAMGDTPLSVMSANLGKVGSNQNGGWDDAGGRDLHVGAWHVGVLPPTAPLPIASATMTGLAFAAWRQNLDRFHLACIGEGSSSSGEFWESLNLAGARGLPICYVLQNNQIALDTPPVHQSGVEIWADKAVAMGIPSWTIDGSDPASIFASVACAREFTMNGGGPTLIHIETMRGCGHAHHHDDLYLGSETGTPPGYVDKELVEYWEAKDPVTTHRELLLNLGVKEDELESIELEETELVRSSREKLDEMEWPDPQTVTKGVTTLNNSDTHDDHLQRLSNPNLDSAEDSGLEVGEYSFQYAESGGWTYSRAIQQAMVEIANSEDSNTVFIGEDMEVAGAFGMNMALKNAGHQDKLVDMPLCEAIIVHTGVGAALSGMRPMVEIQFGGFAALGYNALVNNAAMLRWRWGANCPMTVRIPLGARTRSGPFHANMIESWFANDPGLVVIAPGTPQDAYDLLIEANRCDDPVLFLEHIGLYGLRGGLTGWGQNINQVVDKESVKNAISNNEDYSLGKAKVIRGGRDVSLITWGAMVHVARLAAEELSKEDIEVEIVDLRTIIPFDAKTCIESVKRCGRFAVLHEAQWHGGLGHTIHSRILEEVFYELESQPAVIGALDTPVPFSPPLENHTIPSVEHVVKVLREIVKA